MRHGAIAFAFLAFVYPFCSSAGAEMKVEEKVIGPAGPGTNFQYSFSEHGQHLGSLTMKGSRSVVIVDGVEGPQFDEVYAAATVFDVQPDTNGERTQYYAKGANVVAFSPDGTRYAYAARDGKEVVCIVDGKEIFRTPFSPSRGGVGTLRFSPGGKHVYFMTPTTDTMESLAMVMDGQKGPACAEPVFPVFSPDDLHWAHYAKRPTPQQEGFVVVDGKPVDWVAGRLRYTPDGQHLVGIHNDAQQVPNKASLLVDGKPMLQVEQIDRVVIGATGDIATIGTTDGAKLRQLYINGKAVTGTEFAYQPSFSPNGKRWAALCSGGGAPVQGWCVIDGKKGRAYDQVRDLIFTGDSSKAVYVAEMQGKKFIICDDQEYEGGNYMLANPVSGPGSAHFAYVCNDPMARFAVVDDKKFGPSKAVDNFVFSPDGSRYAFGMSTSDVFGARNLIVDGKVQPFFLTSATPVLFSPDSKRLITMGTPPNGRNEVIVIDDQYLAPSRDTNGMRLIGFTPDSQHFAIGMVQQKDNKQIMNIYVDGKLAGQFDAQNLPGLKPGMWEIAPDGTIIVMGPSNGKEVKRMVITPSSDTSIDTWIAEVKEEKEKAVAAATQKTADDQAAKEKAAADAQAARDKYNADRKAALDKKAADRKAALEKAAADKAAKKAGKVPQD